MLDSEPQIRGRRSAAHGPCRRAPRPRVGAPADCHRAMTRSPGRPAVSATEHVASRGYVEADYTDFAHTGPGTLAGRYLRTFWQPVYVARDLPREQARPIRILGEDFTLYRGASGRP